MAALNILIMLAVAILSLWLVMAVIGGVLGFLTYRRIMRGWDREDQEAAARVKRRVA